MSTVWKVGSRWSCTGTVQSSILDKVFRKYKVIFVGTKDHIFGRIQDGDLIGISDAKYIVAIAQAQGVPRPLGEFSSIIPEDVINAYGHSVPACRVSFMDLSQEDRFIYGRRGACHKLHGEAEARITEFFSRYHNDECFAIQASTRTLLGNKVDKSGLWQDGLRYRVPVYQRPYSWGHKQIHTLVAGILASFYGSGGQREREPMFIGTMQISARFLIDGTKSIYAHNVIDGQQRITTLTLLIHLLNKCYPSRATNVPKDFANRLTTEVNGHIQQELYDIALTTQLEKLSATNGENPYIDGLFLLQQALRNFDLGESDWDPTDTQPLPPSDIPDLISFLTRSLHFVVIETHAGLSKTIQIFNSINTAGMDLSGSDVFKVRLFEFLGPKIKDEHALFKSIDNLYQEVERFNSGRTTITYNINDILAVAQHRLIAKHGLNSSLHSLAPTTFFDRLFDVALGVNIWGDYNREICMGVRMRDDLQVTVFSDVINQCKSWAVICDGFSPDQSFSFKLLDLTRYSRYWFVPAIFHMTYSPDKVTSTKFICQLARLLTSYSVIYGKVVNEAHSFMYQLMDDMLGKQPKPPEHIIASICARSQRLGSDLNSCLLNNNLAWIPKAKALVFRIAIAIDASSNLSHKTVGYAFEHPMDIEHIYAATPNAKEVASNTSTQWEGELNRLGNLILLEYSINRSIKNKSYIEKRVAYLKSDLPAVKHLAENHIEWTPADAAQRREQLANRITAYLLEH